jgi:hypothetical protein
VFQWPVTCDWLREPRARCRASHLDPQVSSLIITVGLFASGCSISSSRVPTAVFSGATSSKLMPAHLEPARSGWGINFFDSKLRRRLETA